MIPIKRLLITAVIIIAILCNFESAYSQDARSYEFIPAPDIGYNDVDGIRLGIRIQGQVPGTFEDGPHRLDLGVWLGTWIPDYPVSYYLSFTEPIPSISDFGSEGNIQLISSIRTGFHRHGLAFNKRWQAGFDETNYSELSVGFYGQKRFELEYVPFPELWQEQWLYILGADYQVYNENPLGRYIAATSHSINVAGNAPGFINSHIELQQLVELNKYFKLRTRVYGGVTSNETVPEYLFSHSFLPAIGWMDRGFTRAKGTIPTPWMEQGFIQVTGGPSLRGYLRQDIEQLNSGIPPLFTSMGAVNLELDFPTPLGRSIRKIPVVGGLINLRSYLFLDSGTSFGLTEMEEERVLSDAGLGFMLSLNVPDYLGKPRGITIRYDIPFWLSDPADESNFKYRSLIGIGAVISL